MFNLILIALSLPAYADFSFTEVRGNSLSGLSQESTETREKVQREISGYLLYRKSATGEKGSTVWADCYEDRKSNAFCELILHKSEPAPRVDTDKVVRTKFVQALVTLDNPKTRAKACTSAHKTLQAIAQDENAESLHARALYWLWKCARLTQHQDLRQIEDVLVGRFPLAHHTLLVRKETHSEEMRAIARGEKEWPVKMRSFTQPNLNVWIAGLEVLIEKNENLAAEDFHAFIDDRLNGLEPEVRLYVAILMERVSARIPSVKPVARAMLPLFQSHPGTIGNQTLKMIFPGEILDTIREQNAQVNPFLFAGLIHQESGLNPRAASSAGAYGLTQMLLPTATDQHRLMTKDKSAEVTKQMLFEPQFSVKLGAADFVRRLKGFDGNEILAIASYNAGETGVRNWLKESPKVSDPQILADILFMNRNEEFHVSQYVAAVLGKQFWYSVLYE